MGWAALDFFERNQALRAELASQGQDYTDLSWYAGQLHFLRTHRYFTAAARSLRDAKKAENLSLLSEFLELLHIQ